MGSIIVSRKELAGLAGICLPWATKSLEKLKKAGLIKFKKGTQHRWYGKAGEVQRIIPIPKPSMQYSDNDISKS